MGKGKVTKNVNVRTHESGVTAYGQDTIPCYKKFDKREVKSLRLSTRNTEFLSRVYVKLTHNVYGSNTL